MFDLQQIQKALDELTQLGNILTLKKNGKGRQAQILKHQHMFRNLKAK